MNASSLRPLLGLALLLPACASAPAPGALPCTTMGCENGYTIDLTAASWPAGAYEVELVVDGVKGKCEAKLPLTAGSRASCSLPGVRLDLSGSALPPEQHSLAALVWSERPAKIEVAVKVNGAALGKPASFTPSYRTVQPNGPRCEPTCTNARDHLSL